MAIERDESISLPSAPPPRPAARKAAIESALRKFDGIEDRPAPRHAERDPGRRAPKVGWSTMNRRPAGALVTAALIAIISVPAIQVALRDRPAAEAPPASESATAQPGQSASLPATVQPQTNDAVAAGGSSAEPAAAPSGLPSVAVQERGGFASFDRGEKAGVVAPAPMMAAPAPSPLVAAPSPPPPPPPPPAEPEAQMNDVARPGSVVVTGSRVRRPNLESATPVAVIGDPHGEFLSRLQAGLRSNDRRAVIRLVGFPLRVTFEGETRTYRSPRGVERDFDRIFTPRVRSAALNQRPETLIVRDGGSMLSNGRLRFASSCSGRSCSEAPIRIREVTP
jgi:hypothetical protein